MSKRLLVLGAILVSLALSAVPGAVAQGPCPPAFCEHCVHQGGTCQPGANTCFCIFG